MKSYDPCTLRWQFRFESSWCKPIALADFKIESKDVYRIWIDVDGKKYPMIITACSVSMLGRSSCFDSSNASSARSVQFCLHFIAYSSVMGLIEICFPKWIATARHADNSDSFCMLTQSDPSYIFSYSWCKSERNVGLWMIRQVQLILSMKWASRTFAVFSSGSLFCRAWHDKLDNSEGRPFVSETCFPSRNASYLDVRSFHQRQHTCRKSCLHTQSSLLTMSWDKSCTAGGVGSIVEDFTRAMAGIAGILVCTWYRVCPKSFDLDGVPSPTSYQPVGWVRICWRGSGAFGWPASEFRRCSDSGKTLRSSRSNRARTSSVL